MQRPWDEIWSHNHFRRSLRRAIAKPTCMVGFLFAYIVSMTNEETVIENMLQPKIRKERAQAIVEFAIVLPVLIALVLGILEVGRLAFIYAAVTNASREAVRFGSAVGFEDNTYYLKYQYCSAIREKAKVSSFLVDLQDSDVVIVYDHGPGTTAFDTCPVGTVRDTTVVINTGQDRVAVTVSANYSPLTNLIPITSQTITSSSARTILGYTEVGP